MSEKTQTLVVQISAQLEVDFSQAELDAIGKTFREFKLGVERTVKSELLPAFAADPHSRVILATLAFPSPRKVKRSGTGGHFILENK